VGRRRAIPAASLSVVRLLPPEVALLLKCVLLPASTHGDVKSWSMVAVGVDACKKGWIAVALRTGTNTQAHYLEGIEDLGEAIPDAEAIGIDIPIGLPTEGRRAADIEAKKVLGPRSNSVFFTPVRAALEARDHLTATRLSLELTGHGISQQSFALRSKIFEVERWLPSAPCPVWEVHPEVSFRFLMGVPASASKKSWTGMIERRSALLAVGIDLDQVTGNGAIMSATDDMLDAGAAAWTAKRLLEGAAQSLPHPPEIDAAGRNIAIWA
jgi:predicted RNase H-like nuclease